MKTVHTKTHSPILLKTCDVGWSDVWLSFTAKPARRKVTLAPTFISKRDLEFDLEFAKEWQAENPNDASALNELNELQGVYDRLQSEEIVVCDAPSADMPNIYINKPYFRRKDAEKMIDALMKKLGYRGAKVKWQKPRGGFVIPVSV